MKALCFDDRVLTGLLIMNFVLFNLLNGLKIRNFLLANCMPVKSVLLNNIRKSMEIKLCSDEKPQHSYELTDDDRFCSFNSGSNSINGFTQNGEIEQQGIEA